MTSTTTTSSSSALAAATIFLTRPLALSNALPQPTLTRLQLFLHSALAAHPPRLAFTGTAALPPLPLQLACVAFGIRWADWMRALGGTAFDLVLDPARVYVVKRSTGQVGVVWAAPKAILAPKPAVGESNSDSDSEPEEEFESRPSSRSSTVSDSAFSFTSHSSRSSATSVSSAKSSTAKPASVPAPTKYLYQGGVSTVLTGGVMLGGGGGGSSAPTPRTTAPAPAYTPPHRQVRGRTQTQPSPAWTRKAPTPAPAVPVSGSGSGSCSWRRAVRVAA